MKNPFILLASFCLVINAQAQDVFSNHTNTALQQVIQDYPNKFRNIKGDRIAGNTLSADYRSKVEISGSGICIITQNNADNREILSWKCDLFETNDFDAARSKFKEFYDYIKNTIVKINGQQPFILIGRYENPSEDKKFTAVVFQFLPFSNEMQKLKVELGLKHDIGNWKVVMCIHDND